MDNLSDLTGVGATTIEKLNDAGYYNFMSIATASPSTLSDVSGLSESKARKIVQEARTKVELGFKTGSQVETKRETIARIPLHFKDFDDMIGGGFECGTLVEVHGGFGVGKCVSSDTKVLVDNELVKIENLWDKKSKIIYDDEGEYINKKYNIISFDDDTGKSVVTNSTQLYRMKCDKILKITTQNGRELKLSLNHQLPTFDNGLTWKKSKDFKIGEYIRIPYLNSEYNSNDITNDDAYFVGMFVAKGGSNPFAIYTGDDKLKKWVLNYLKRKWEYNATHSYERGCWRILIRKITVDALLSSFRNKKSVDKHIPSYIKNNSNEILEHFFSGYYESDGWLNGHSMTTKSEKLSSDLCYLLNRLNTNYLSRDSYNKKYGLYKNINITGTYNFNLHFKSKTIKNRQSGFFGVSENVTKFLINNYKKFRKNVVISSDKIKTVISNNSNNNISRVYNKTITLFSKEFKSNDREINDVYEKTKHCGNFIWDKIINIELINYNDYIYDLVVPKYHNFIGGDIPTLYHNTQLCHMLSASCQKSYPGSNVIYIDSENCFRPDRVRDFATTLELNPDDVLEHVHHAIATNTDHQMLLISEVEKMIGQGMDTKLIIVDSLTSHFRSEFAGRGTLAPRQQKLNAHMHDLMKLAMVNDLVVFMTNQVMSDPGAFFGNPEKAIGGNIVAHNASTRIYLRRGQKGSRVAKLIDSPNLPDGECSYFVTKEGLVEVK